VLVTGGAGFIGSNLVRHLLEKCGDLECVVVYDVLTYAGNPHSLAGLAEAHGSRYAFIQGDICEYQTFAAAIQTHSIDTVIHLAAESHVDRSIDGPMAFVKTNVVGTATILEVLRNAWKGREYRGVRLHHVSTDEVYGSLGPADPPVTLGTPYDPSSPYSASKAASDHMVRAWQRTYGIPATLSVCTNNYGPYQFPEKLIPHMIVKALRGEALPVYGDGHHVRDWLHVGDHCRAIEACVRYGTPGRTYHVSGGLANEIQNIDVVRIICESLDTLRPDPRGPYFRLVQYVTDRPGHDRRYALDASKTAAKIGASPSVNAAQGLPATVKWYLDNWKWVENILSGEYKLKRIGTL
jgi:dTDP-glucose 4,6-dehydratase